MLFCNDEALAIEESAVKFESIFRISQTFDCHHFQRIFQNFSLHIRLQLLLLFFYIREMPFSLE